MSTAGSAATLLSHPPRFRRFFTSPDICNEHGLGQAVHLQVDPHPPSPTTFATTVKISAPSDCYKTRNTSTALRASTVHAEETKAQPVKSRPRKNGHISLHTDLLLAGVGAKFGVFVLRMRKFRLVALHFRSEGCPTKMAQNDEIWPKASQGVKVIQNL